MNLTKPRFEAGTAMESNDMPPTPVRPSLRKFHALLLLLTGLLALLVLAEAFRLLPVTSDNMYPESAGVLDAQRWAQGLPLYSDYRKPPFLITHFPPLWYGVLAGAAKLGARSLDSLEWWGRILSMACLFAVVTAGYGWNRRAGLSPEMALLTPTFYLAFPVLIPWAVTARPDFPSLFLAFLAIYCVGVRPSTGWVCTAAIAASAALLSRHNAVAAPVAIVLWLVWSRRWIHAVLFCGVVAAVVVPVLAFFQISTGMLLLNLSGSKFGPLAFTYVRDVLLRLLGTPGNGLVVLLVALGITGFVESWKEVRGRLLGLYLASACLFALVGSAAAGAAVNHYIETGFALAAFVPFGVARVYRVWKGDSSLGVLATALIVVLLAPALDLQRWNVMHSRKEDFRRILPLAEHTSVFTDIPYLAARIHPAQLSDLVSLTYTERKPGPAAWSSTPIVNNLRNRAYDLIILDERADAPYDAAARYPRYPHLDTDIRAAIGQNYELCFVLDGSYIYGRFSGSAPGSGNGCPAPVAGPTTRGGPQAGIDGPPQM